MNTGKMEGGTFATGSGLLTATGAETLYDTTVAVPYCINGIGYSFATKNSQASPALDSNTGEAFVALATDEACVFVWCVNSSAAIKAVQGPVVEVDPDLDIRKVDPQYPMIPADLCPIAVHIVQTAGTSDPFTFGTSNWNATGITTLIRNIFTMPKRPINTVTA